MAMFVRNPHKTNNGAETDRAPIAPVELGSDLDKQTIKAMIERKRQNDLIRRREFAQLRKLRSSKDGASAKGSGAAPSFFQSSFIPSDMMGRADTLKKIDEIEAQMSKQWWKGKAEEAKAHAAASALASLPTQPMPAMAAGRKFDLPNVAEHLQQGAGLHFVPTVKANEFGETDAHSLNAQHTKDDTDFLSTLKEFPAGQEAPPDPKTGLGEPMAVDAVLEDAAMRFANGDQRGAEAGLLAALRQPRALETTAKGWIAALLDFYRATHNQVGFFGSITEFARYLGATEPQWEDIGGALQMAKASPTGGAIWNAPAHLDAAAMEELRNAMYSNPMPWHIDWGSLESIAQDAMPQLAGLFYSLCREPVKLGFSRAHVLVDSLRSMMVTGDKNVNPDWWLMRLNVLRVTQMMDDFEVVALDYCITYEVSPPSWEKASCECSNIQDRPPETHPPPILSEARGPSRDCIPALELRGSLLSDSAEAVLAGLEHDDRLGLPITVSCHHLVRVDFSAAGSILNWAAQRQAEGSLVQFRDVHYLVAVFFHVIGIHDHARIVPREL